MRLEVLMARMRARIPPAALERIVTAWAAARRHPGTLLTAALVGGVVVMILHWS